MAVTDEEICVLLERPADATYRDVAALAQALLDARVQAAQRRRWRRKVRI